MIVGIRGATFIEKDSPEEVEKKVLELLNEIHERNKIKKVICAIFSVTPDIKSQNPATVARKKFGWKDIPLMCLQEATFENSPGMIIRVLIVCEAKASKFVYLHKARDLRR